MPQCRPPAGSQQWKYGQLTGRHAAGHHSLHGCAQAKAGSHSIAGWRPGSCRAEQQRGPGSQIRRCRWVLRPAAGGRSHSSPCNQQAGAVRLPAVPAAPAARALLDASAGPRPHAARVRAAAAGISPVGVGHGVCAAQRLVDAAQHLVCRRRTQQCHISAPGPPGGHPVRGGWAASTAPRWAAPAGDRVHAPASLLTWLFAQVQQPGSSQGLGDVGVVGHLRGASTRHAIGSKEMNRSEAPRRRAPAAPPPCR